LQTVYLKNGEITLQHNRLFSDEQIVAAARDLIVPCLSVHLSGPPVVSIPRTVLAYGRLLAQR
jgi:hypothetical protein